LICERTAALVTRVYTIHESAGRMEIANETSSEEIYMAYHHAGII
jgi:hypothetical protein